MVISASSNSPTSTWLSKPYKGSGVGRMKLSAWSGGTQW